MEFQTRNVNGELRFFETLIEAVEHAEENSIWKISFSLSTGERVRLIRDEGKWVYEPLEFGGMK